MKRLSIAGFGRLALVALVFIPAPLVHSADKIKFPYSPIGWESLPWFVGKEGGYYEKYGLDVEMFFQGASSEIIQAMLAGDANFAGSAGPAIISNVIGGGDVNQVAALVKTFTIPLYSQPSLKTMANKNPDVVKRFLKASLEGLKRVLGDKNFTTKILGQYTKITDPKLLEDSYEWASAAFVKDPRVPLDAEKALVDQMVALKMVDAAAAAKTPTTAYFDNQYVEALEKEGFLKKLWP